MSKKRKSKTAMIHYGNPAACGKSPSSKYRHTDDKDSVTCTVCKITRIYTDPESCRIMRL